jgi:glycosyltransferase involved in cell wall biosynthesis
MSHPLFSIVTPCFNALPYLKLCCASVADQQGVTLEHIVVDGGSTDGTVDWLKGQSGLRWVSEPDQGMYNAINKGLRMAQGELVAHLNSDEQYLPGALAAVARRFREDAPEILFGDTIVIGPQGDYLCSRRVLTPLYYHTLTCHLSTFTAATFFSKDILKNHDAYFDESWRCSGDVSWMLNVLRRKARMARLGQYTSAFMDRGPDNLALSAQAGEETRRRAAETSAWIGRLAPFWKWGHRLRRLLYGVYFVKPFQYAVYTPATEGQRTLFDVKRPGFLWKSRLTG